MNRDQVITEHSEICAYIGMGSKSWQRTSADHKGRGAKKYLSEHQRIKQCGKKLYNWCVNIGIEPVSDWSKINKDQLPDAQSSCIKRAIES